MKVKTYYLAGPMRGIPNLNREAFEEARESLRALGYTIYCPSENQERMSEANPAATLHDYIKHNIAVLLECDGIILLPGSDKSKGARVEKDLAFLLGKEVYSYSMNESGKICLVRLWDEV